MTREEIDLLATELKELGADSDSSAQFDLAERIIDESRLIGYATWIPSSLITQATAHRKRGEYEQSKIKLDLALIEAQGQSDNESIIHALLDAGNSERDRGNLSVSKDFFDRAFEIAAGSGNQRGMVLAQSGCAELYRQWGLNEIAIDKMRESWALAKGTDWEHIPLGGLAELVAAGGDLRTAITLVQPVIEYRKRTGLTGLESFAHCWVAGLHAQLGEFQQAREHYLKGMQLAEASNSRLRVAGALYRAGECEVREGEFDSAEKKLQEALKIYSDAGLYQGAYCLVALATMAIRRGNSEAALQHLTTATNQYDALSIRDSLEAIHGLFAEGYEQQGNWQLVAYHEKERRKVIEETNSSNVKTKLAGIQQLLASEQERRRTEIEKMKREQLERELANTTLQLVAHTNRLAEFRDSIREIVSKMPPSEATVRELRAKLKELAADAIDWKKYDEQFKAAYPEFIRKLTEKHPNLTAGDVRLCALVRMNLKSDEIARLFSVTERAIETHRFRVRKKLKLPREMDLMIYLAKM